MLQDVGSFHRGLRPKWDGGAELVRATLQDTRQSPRLAESRSLHDAMKSVLLRGLVASKRLLFFRCFVDLAPRFGFLAAIEILLYCLCPLGQRLLICTQRSDVQRKEAAWQWQILEAVLRTSGVSRRGYTAPTVELINIR